MFVAEVPEEEPAHGQVIDVRLAQLNLELLVEFEYSNLSSDFWAPLVEVTRVRVFLTSAAVSFPGSAFVMVMPTSATFPALAGFF